MTPRMEVIGVAVLSLDGCLTRHDVEGTGFASVADRRFFRDALQSFDCAIMGGRGYRAARDIIRQYLSPEHRRIILTRDPLRHAGDAVPGSLEFRSEDPATVARELAGQGHRRCGVLGGPRTLTALMDARLLTELWVTLEPVAFGTGRRLFDGAVDYRFELLATVALSEDTMLLRYRPVFGEVGTNAEAPPSASGAL